LFRRGKKGQGGVDLPHRTRVPSGPEKKGKGGPAKCGLNKSKKEGMAIWTLDNLTWEKKKRKRRVIRSAEGGGKGGKKKGRGIRRENKQKGGKRKPPFAMSGERKKGRRDGYAGWQSNAGAEMQKREEGKNNHCAPNTWGGREKKKKPEGKGGGKRQEKGGGGAMVSVLQMRGEKKRLEMLCNHQKPVAR